MTIRQIESKKGDVLLISKRDYESLKDDLNQINYHNLQHGETFIHRGRKVFTEPRAYQLYMRYLEVLNG